MTYTKKLISIMLIAILMLSIIPFGATEQVENPAPLEQAAQIEETAPEEAPPSPTEASTPAEDPPLPTEAPVPIVTEAPTEIPAPVVTEAPTEQPAPTEQTSTEEPPSPTEQATQQPLPSSTVQAAIVEKIGWEHAPLYVNVGPDEIGLGNSFVVSLAVDSGGTGKFTYAYYIYKGNTVVQKTGYSTNTSYTYTPKTTGKFHAVVFIKNEKGETRTLTSFYKVNVVEKHNPIGVAASALTNNIVLGDTKSFDIYSWDGAASHMHAYYVYCNNKLIERFPYKQAKYFIELGSHYSQVSYTPKSPGKYKFVFFAKDTLGKTQTYTTNEYLVSGAALDLRANVAFKKYHIGSVANITAQASGGSGTYQYAYYV
ncbi:MAG: hypothetical protein GYA87_10135, partial [Christensenellaceae bacterium]|nr:hypothetical protein [Christensenellaceae bacterium]